MICRSNAPAPLISLPNDCIELGWPGRENLTRFQNGEIKYNLPQSAVGSDLSTVLACCVVPHPIFYLHMCICVLAFVIEWNNIKDLRRQPHMLKLNEPLAKHTSGKSLQQTWKAPGSGRGRFSSKSLASLEAPRLDASLASLSFCSAACQRPHNSSVRSTCTWDSSSKALCEVWLSSQATKVQRIFFNKALMNAI